MLLFLLVRTVVDCIKSIDENTALTLLTLKDLANSDNKHIQSVAVQLINKLVEQIGEIPKVQEQISELIKRHLTNLGEGDIKKTALTIKKYIRVSSSNSFEDLLSDGIVPNIIGYIKSNISDNTDTSVRNIIISINLLDSVLKTNHKVKQDKLENNKLLEKDDSLDVIEELQSHKDRRVRDAAYRLIDNNLVAE